MDDARISQRIKVWEEFCSRQAGKEKFKLNPDKERVKLLARGVLSNEEEKGFKYCPCRMISKNPVEDAKLICPCNFKAQKTWREKGECWCSLFVRA
jgi:ferredoxin-thioredoxin reductase catalytic chain